jgi:hypothetical protein
MPNGIRQVARQRTVEQAQSNFERQHGQQGRVSAISRRFRRRRIEADSDMLSSSQIVLLNSAMRFRTLTSGQFSLEDSPDLQVLL